MRLSVPAASSICVPLEPMPRTFVSTHHKRGAGNSHDLLFFQHLHVRVVAKALFATRWHILGTLSAAVDCSLSHLGTKLAYSALPSRPIEIGFWRHLDGGIVGGMKSLVEDRVQLYNNKATKSVRWHALMRLLYMVKIARPR